MSDAIIGPGGMGEALQIAKQLSTSGLIPRALQGKPGDVLVVLLTGKELGLGPMQSLRGIHVVDGKAVIAADLIVGLCARERTVCEWFRLVESTDTAATYETKRAGHPESTRMTWTIEQAKQAGITGKQNWRNYPSAMLRARCASALARAVYPDLVAGVYDPDELGQSEFKPEPSPPHHRPIQNAEIYAAEAKAQREEDAQIEVPALPAETARSLVTPEQQAVVDRVKAAIGGEVMPADGATTETIGFGRMANARICDLTDGDLSDAIRFVYANGKKAQNEDFKQQMRDTLKKLRAEEKRRQAREPRVEG